MNIENILLENAKSVSLKHEQEIKTWNGLVLANNELFIPGYIPYIGKNYLDVKNKIMIYTLSQNVHPNSEFIVKYGNNWKNKQNITDSLNRQNLLFNNYGEIQIHPFDTGHLPILAGILNFLILHSKNLNPIAEVSATNLSKFSFRNNKNLTVDNDKSLNKCFDWFSIKEIEVLKPDYIICAGDKVFNVIKANINNLNISSKPIKISFPSLLVINRHYKKELTTTDKNIFNQILSIFSEDFLLRKTSYKTEKKIIDIIRRDEYYFIKMYESIQNQI